MTEDRDELVERLNPVLERISEALYGLPLREALAALGSAMAKTFAAAWQGRPDDEIQAAAQRIVSEFVRAAREGNVAETFSEELQ